MERGPIDLDVFEAEESKTTIGVKAEPFSQGVDGKGDKSMARRIPNDRTGRGDVNVQLAFTATAVFGVEEFPIRCSLDAERDRAGKEMCPCPTGVEPGAQESQSFVGGADWISTQVAGFQNCQSHRP